MVTAAISSEDIKSQLERALTPFGLTVTEFLSMKLDEIDNYELRDLWLMTKGLINE